jgi:methyl-accepting chemotaxis protein
MTWLTNLRTGPRLLLGFGIIIVLLGLAVFAGYRGMEQIRAQSEIESALRELESNLHESRALMLTLILGSGRGESIEAARRDISDNSERNDVLRHRLAEVTRGYVDIAEPLRELERVSAEHRRVRAEQILAPLAQGKSDSDFQGALAAQMQTYRSQRAVLASLTDHAHEASVRAMADAKQVLAYTTAAALVAALVIVSLLTRLTATPLERLAVAADRIAEGDLNVSALETARMDEVGVLSQAFQRMIHSLSAMVEVAGRIAAQDLTVPVQPQSPRDQLGQSLATMVLNLRGATGSLSASISTLAASASEILAATAQVATGAAETGTAIAQTTTTVEEVKQTAQLASQKAKVVADGAQKAAAIGHTGQKAVEASIEGMRQIKLQMESIAGTVVRLSENSQAIGEIIAAVNDLAEQSNLLAVNAAIEAAKAGEQGKGFSVVAQEVRSLAEQSRQATAQVRSILHDIQKSTTAAVLATEQGSKAVELGMKQSNEAGDAISQLSGTIHEAAQAATQIAASSQQQLVGTDQVALAMQNIKQASMQNVSATRQAETAAQNLNQIGGSLKDIVGKYKL